MALYLVRQLTSSELLQRLKTIGVKHPELCKALGEHYGAFPEVTGGGSGSITADLPLLGACRLWGHTDTEPGSLRRSLEDAKGGGQRRVWSRCAHRTEHAGDPRKGVLSMWGLFGAS